MKTLARYVVIALLAVMFFPAVSLAQPGRTPDADVPSVPFGPRPRPSTPPAAPAAPAAAAGTTTAARSIADLAARERRSKELENFRGGGVYVYLGSGALAVLVVVLLILLI